MLRTVASITAPVSCKELDVCVYFDEISSPEAVYLLHRGKLHGKPFLLDDPDPLYGGSLRKAARYLVKLKIYHGHEVKSPEDFPPVLFLVE